MINFQSSILSNSQRNTDKIAGIVVKNIAKQEASQKYASKANLKGKPQGQIAKTSHFDLLIPRVDITQSDIRSLDGGVLGGERTSDKVESILDSIVNPK